MNMFLNKVTLYGRINKVITEFNFNLRYNEISNRVVLDALKQGLYIYIRTLSTGSVRKPKVDIELIKSNGVRRVNLNLGPTEEKFDFPILKQVKGHRITEDLKNHVNDLRNRRKNHQEVELPLIVTIGKLGIKDECTISEFKSNFERIYGESFVHLNQVTSIDKWFESYKLNVMKGKVYPGSLEAIQELISDKNPYLEGENDLKFKSIVLEIANRAVMLNGFSGIDSLVKVQGVVFVSKDRDCSDNCIMRLYSTFPNLQFIIEK